MMRIRLELIAAALLFVTLIAIVFAWRAERRDAATLRAQLQSAQTSMNQATARQDVRDAQTKKNVATLQHQKAAVQTPAQILQALPTVLPLPTPLTATLIRAPTPLEREVATSANFPAGSSATSSAVGNPPIANKNSAPADSLPIKIPPEDLKPLYDFAVDCKTCAVRLASAQADLKDDQSKAAALVKERDAALTAAHGGSVLRRAARAAKWFVVGAAVGAAAARLAH